MAERPVCRAQLLLVAVSAGLLALDLALKARAERGLEGQAVDLGPLELRLAHNPGVSFGIGSSLPSWVVLTVTGLVTTSIAVWSWRTARTAGPAMWLPLAAVLAGAVSNLVDRAADGVVTDYFHTGWFPTFNGADALITLGMTALLAASLRTANEDYSTAGSPERPS